MNQLKDTGKEILTQLQDLLRQLSDTQYTAELDLLNGNSIGKHVRHIVEFFELLADGYSEGIVNYDKRVHQPLYETDIRATLQQLDALQVEINKFDGNPKVFLQVSYTDRDEDALKINSSMERELAYNIEHAIHHMAIIKIAVQTIFPTAQLPENFGVAYSTMRYRQAHK